MVILKSRLIYIIIMQMFKMKTPITKMHPTYNWCMRMVFLVELDVQEMFYIREGQYGRIYHKQYYDGNQSNNYFLVIKDGMLVQPMLFVTCLVLMFHTLRQLGDLNGEKLALTTS